MRAVYPRDGSTYLWNVSQFLPHCTVQTSSYSSPWDMECHILYQFNQQNTNYYCLLSPDTLSLGAFCELWKWCIWWGQKDLEVDHNPVAIGYPLLYGWRTRSSRMGINTRLATSAPASLQGGSEERGAEMPCLSHRVRPRGHWNVRTRPTLFMRWSRAMHNPSRYVTWSCRRNWGIVMTWQQPHGRKCTRCLSVECQDDEFLWTCVVYFPMHLQLHWFYTVEWKNYVILGTQWFI